MITRAFSQFFEVKYEADVLEPLVMFSGVGLLASLLLVLDGIDLGSILY